jgi:hypothetical protein
LVPQLAAYHATVDPQQTHPLCSRKRLGAADAGVSVGAEFNKRFGSFGVFRGTVVRDDGRRGWLVRYEDGDVEHLSQRDLLDLIRATEAGEASHSAESDGDEVGSVMDDGAATDSSGADDARAPPRRAARGSYAGGRAGWGSSGGGEMRVGVAYSTLTTTFPSTIGLFASALVHVRADAAAGTAAAASGAYGTLTLSFPSTVGLFASALPVPVPAAGATAARGLTLAQRRAIASRARQQPPPQPPPTVNASGAGMREHLRRRAAGAVRRRRPVPAPSALLRAAGALPLRFVRGDAKWRGSGRRGCAREWVRALSPQELAGDIAGAVVGFSPADVPREGASGRCDGGRRGGGRRGGGGVRRERGGHSRAPGELAR